MSEPESRTATTAFGEVEYETVACSSCGTEVAKEDADRLAAGDLNGIDYWSHRGDDLEFRNYTLGWVCPYCREEGIVSTPADYDIRLRTALLVTAAVAALAGHLLTAALML